MLIPTHKFTLMNISQFARYAVQKPKTNNQYQISGLREALKTKDPIALLIDTLEESGAKVQLKKHDYFISKNLGGIPARLLGKPREEVRKSFAFLRVFPKKEFVVRADLAIANRGTICINKSAMEMLQLSNMGLKAIILINTDDIFANIEQLTYSPEARLFQNGYLLTGPLSERCLVDPCLRKIPDLTVYLISKQKKKNKKQSRFFASFNAGLPL